MDTPAVRSDVGDYDTGEDQGLMVRIVKKIMKKMTAAAVAADDIDVGDSAGGYSADGDNTDGGIAADDSAGGDGADGGIVDVDGAGGDSDDGDWC